MNNKNKKSLSCPLILSLALMLMVSTTSFAEWDIVPVIKVGGEIDDNANIDPRTDQEINLSGYLVEASADIVYSSAKTNFDILPIFLYRSYPDNPEFDSNDLFMQSRFNHQMKSSSIGFWASFDEQQVRTAERADTDLQTEDPDEISGDESGRVGLSGDRTKWRFVPRWNYSFSNVSSIAAQIDYFDVRYEDVFLNLLTDYTDARVNLSYRRALSSRNTLVTTLTGRRYAADDPSVEDVTGVGFLVGLDRAVTEKTQIRAMIGVENTEQIAGQKDPEVIGDLTLTRRLETITLLAQYRRSVNATGAGQVSVRDQVNVNFTRRLSEKISMGLGIRAYQTRGIGDAASIVDDREYLQLRTQLIWYLSPKFSIEADYRYTILDRGVLFDGRANSNHINLWFNYQPTAAAR